MTDLPPVQIEAVLQRYADELARMTQRALVAEALIEQLTADEGGDDA